MSLDLEMEDFGWLIQEMARAELPDFWVKEFDNSGRVFYYNTSNYLVQPYHPLFKQFRAMMNEVFLKKVYWADQFNIEKKQMEKCVKTVQVAKTKKQQQKNKDKVIQLQSQQPFQIAKKLNHQSSG